MECNHFRIHGESQAETQRKQQEKYVKKYLEKQKNKPVVQPKKIYTIKNQSKKETTQQNQLSTVKTNLRIESQQEDKYYCWGCGVSGQRLDCSHILSVKQRKDLELDKENMNLFCRDCHDRWESWDIEQMLFLETFLKDLLYIHKNDNRTFQRIIIKMNELVLYINKGLVIEEKILEKLKLISKETLFIKI